MKSHGFFNVVSFVVLAAIYAQVDAQLITTDKVLFEGTNLAGKEAFLPFFHNLRVMGSPGQTVRLCISIIDENIFEIYDLNYDEKTDVIIKMGEFFVCDTILLMTEGVNRRIAFLIVDDQNPFGYELVETLVGELFTKATSNGAPDKRIIEEMRKLYSLQAGAELPQENQNFSKSLDAVTSITELLQQENYIVPNNRIFRYNMKELIAVNEHLKTAVIHSQTNNIIKQIQDTLSGIMPMYHYLEKVKSDVEQDDGKHFLFVIGNESCDLDSAMSAIAFARFLHDLTSDELKKYILADVKLDESVVIVPLLHIKSVYRKLKTESKYYLKQLRLSIDIVPTIEDVRDCNWGKAHIILVDHYTPTTQLINPASIVAIYDHHMDYSEDSKLITVPEQLRKKSQLVVRPVGSTATVIADLVLNFIEKKIPSHEPIPSSYLTILKLLHGPIYLDTENFKWKSKHAKPVENFTPAQEDQAVSLRLEEIVDKYCPHWFKRDRMFPELQKALIDLNGLSPFEVLHKDLKIVVMGDGEKRFSVAIPFIPMPAHKFLMLYDPEVVADHINQFMSTHKCHFIVLMGYRQFARSPSKQGIAIIPNRHFHIQSNLNNFKHLIKTELERMVYNDMIWLEELTLPSQLDGSLFFRQLNGTSRKEVLPAVKTAITAYIRHREMMVQILQKSGEIKARHVRDMTDSFLTVDGGVADYVSAPAASAA